MGNHEEFSLVKEKVTLGDVMNHIGSFHRFQIILAITVCIAALILSVARFEYVFTAARIPARCYISECESEVPEYSAGWLVNAIPKRDGVLDGCHRYVGQFGRVAESDFGRNANTSLKICPASWFDFNTTVKCEGYVYENNETVVYDFDLGCNEWYRSLIGSAKFAGVFFGVQISGILSDKFGRRFAFLLSVFVTTVVVLTRTLVSSYYAYVILVFTEMCVGGSAVSVAFILLSEVVHQKYRAKVTAAMFMSIASACGYILLGAISWFIKPWRILLRVIYALISILLTYYWIFNESVIWLQSKGRYEDANNIIRKIARVNNTTISDSILFKMKLSLEEEKRNATTYNVFLPLLVFRYKRVILRCIVLPICWSTSSLIYYGIASNSLNIKGNGYINFLCLTLSEMFAYSTVPFVLDKLGRKKVLTVGFYACAICMIANAFLGVQLFIYIGLYCNASVVMTLYVYTAELYPTNYRNRLFGYNSMLARVGSMLGPIVPYMELEIWKYLPPLIFVTLGVLSGSLVILLPETLKIRLPETMEEANNMGSKSSDS